MATSSQSWSPPVETAWWGVATAAALLLFALSWLTLQHGTYRDEQIRDTLVYQSYGDAIAEGGIPYRDFRVEYPPAALPVFVLPSLAAGAESEDDVYRRWFEALMLACGALAIVLVALTLRALGRDPAGAALPLAFVALTPLALGSVVLSRFDLWPAALVAGSVAALSVGRDRLALGVLGLATAAKVYPAVLAPLFVARIWRRRGRREALVAGGVGAAVAGLCVAPFLVLGPEGVWASVVRQVTRPLQIESLGAGILLASHHAFGLDVAVDSSHGSQNLTGRGPEALAVAQSAAQVAALVAIWVAYARGPANLERLLRYSAAAVVAFVALGKVASPQFLVWLLPLVPLVRGRRGLAASALLAVALVLTQLWFPYRYWDLVFDLDTAASWLVLGRDLVLVGLLFVLVWPEPGRGAVASGLEELGWRTADGSPVSREPPYGISVVVWRRGTEGLEWLLLHRAHHGPGYEGDWAWGPPSGARLPDEPVDACARRELHEEAGLALDVRLTSCGTDEWLLYAAEAPADAAVVLSAEHDAFRWLPLDEAAAVCLPAQVADGLRAVAATVRP